VTDFARGKIAGATDLESARRATEIHDTMFCIGFTPVLSQSPVAGARQAADFATAFWSRAPRQIALRASTRGILDPAGAGRPYGAPGERTQNRSVCPFSPPFCLQTGENGFWSNQPKLISAFPRNLQYLVLASQQGQPKDTQMNTATINNIPLNAEESGRATADKEAKDRCEKLRGLSEDATYLIATMQEYTALAEVAEKHDLARDDFFSEKMMIPGFRDRIQRLRDWATTKKHSDFLTVDGKRYKSIKKLFTEKFGVSYETVRRVCSQMARLAALLDTDDTVTAITDDPPPQKPPVIIPPPAKTAAPAQSKPTTQPAVEEVLSVNGHAPVIDLLRSTLQHIADCTGVLTAAEKSVYYGNLIDELQNELDELDSE